MNTKTIITSALSLALAAGVAGASPGEYERDEYYLQRGPIPFELVDLNRDGVVTPEEHAQVRAERHEARAEYGYPMRGAPYAPRFEQIDTDGDNVVSREEFSSWHAQRMQRYPGAGRGGRWAR